MHTRINACVWNHGQVAFDTIGSINTNTISKQRKKQEPAVMAQLDERVRRLNSLKGVDHTET